MKKLNLLKKQPKPTAFPSPKKEKVKPSKKEKTPSEPVPIYDGEYIFFPNGYSYDCHLNLFIPPTNDNKQKSHKASFEYVAQLAEEYFTGEVRLSDNRPITARRTLDELISKSEELGANLLVKCKTRRTKGIYLLFQVSDQNILSQIKDYTVPALKEKQESKRLC